VFARAAIRREPRGTSLNFRHGHDVPITRASLTALVLRVGRVDADADLLTEELVHFPETRHYQRTKALLRDVVSMLHR
jgi:hypothetical protein